MATKLEPLRLLQYDILAKDRRSTDSTLWQAPSVALAGQSFLLSAALNSNLSITPRIIAGLASLLISLASAHLLRRHKYLEVRASMALAEIEREFQSQGNSARLLHDKPEAPDNTWLFPSILHKSAVTIWIIAILALGSLGMYPLLVLLWKTTLEPAPFTTQG